MTEVQTLGWLATNFSAFRHYWKTRPHTDIAVARCGPTAHQEWLEERPWKGKCPHCEIRLGDEGKATE